MAMNHLLPDFDEELSDQDFLDWFFRELRESQGFFQSIWQENSHLWDMYAGQSFSPEEKQHLLDTQRPVIDPPFAAGIVDTVVGAEAGQQMEPIFRGTDEGTEDEVKAEWLTKLVRNGWARCEAMRVIEEAHRDMLVGGYGFAVQQIDIGTVPVMPKMKGLMDWQVWPDPDSVERNLADARFFDVEYRWPLDVAKARWPEKGTALDRAYTPANLQSQVHLPTVTKADNGSTERRGVEIHEFHYQRSMKRAKWVDPVTGEKHDDVESEFRKRQKELGDANKALLAGYQAEAEAWEEAALAAATPLDDPFAMPAPPPGPQPVPPELGPELRDEDAYLYNGPTFYRAYICGGDASQGGLLENVRLVGYKEHLVLAMTGFPWKQRAKQRVRYYGLMRKVYDLQLWYVRAMQSYLDAQSRKIKGGGFIGSGAFENEQHYNKFVKQSSTPGMWHKVQDVSQIKENPPMSGEPGLQEIFRTMIEMIGLVSGVTQALQGTLTQDRSNVLVTNLQEQGLQMLAPIRAPRTAFLKTAGRLYACLCLKQLAPADIDRILGAQEVEGMTYEMVPDPMTGQPVKQPILGEDGQPVTAGSIMKDVELLDYDVQVDVGVATAGQKMAVWQVMNQHGMSQVLQQVMPGGEKIWVPEFLGNAPLPGTIAKRMRDGAEAFFEKQETAQTAQGILDAFGQLMQADPDQAQGIMDQVTQMMMGGQQQPPPQEGAMNG